MINITDKAKKKLISLWDNNDNINNCNLRVSVKGGGCSGLMYDLKFDTKIEEEDEMIKKDGITILVDKKSILYLLGTTLDFSDGLNGKGFQFINPNASRTCGCGESFSL